MAARPRRIVPIVSAALALSAIHAMAHSAPCPTEATNCITYRGEGIRLSRSYASYEAYVADPQNISPTEIERVARLMHEAVQPASFPSRDEAFAALSELRFPGYGAGSLKTLESTGAAELRVMFFEIPRTGQARFVAIAGDQQGFRVIDDFVASYRQLADVRWQGGELLYGDGRGTVITRHQAWAKTRP
jgi:hypothetical protein